MYTLTRNCSLGDFDNCGCDDTRNGQRGDKLHLNIDGKSMFWVKHVFNVDNHLLTFFSVKLYSVLQLCSYENVMGKTLKQQT